VDPGAGRWSGRATPQTGSTAERRSNWSSERDVGGAEVLAQLLDGAGSDDRRRDVGVVELPREGDLRGGRIDFSGDRPEDVERLEARVRQVSLGEPLVLGGGRILVTGVAAAVLAG
jgi:hypothetical protein